MNEEKLFRMLTSIGVVLIDNVPTVADLRRQFGMRQEVAQKWVNVLSKLPRRSCFDSQKATAAARRLRELCAEFLDFYENATGGYAKQAAIQRSYENEQDLRDDKIINGTLSRMPEAPKDDDIDYGMRLTTEDLKNFVPTDGLDDID